MNCLQFFKYIIAGVMAGRVHSCRVAA